MENDQIYYYFNDHLGTPQILIDINQQTVWQADYDAFGKAQITVNTVENNLRFAGQYYDEETGLHYNYFRYYDPSTGRYITSDPIGLTGGLNTYLYANCCVHIYHRSFSRISGRRILKFFSDISTLPS